MLKTTSYDFPKTKVTSSNCLFCLKMKMFNLQRYETQKAANPQAGTSKCATLLLDERPNYGSANPFLNLNLFIII